MLRRGAVHKIVVGAIIVIVHGAALHGMALFQPAVQTTPAAANLTVRLLTEPRATPKSQPPRLSLTMPPLQLPVAVMPEVEIAEPPAADRAITMLSDASAEIAGSIGPKLISQVEYVREPAPRYPPRSKRLREQGVVLLRVVIDEHGRAARVDVESSSGYVRLDDAAREAVLQAAFRPYIEDGSPRRAQVLIPIEFAIGRSAA